MPSKLFWVVVGQGGNLADSGIYGTRRSARMIAACFDRSDRRFDPPYRAVRARLTWIGKKRGASKKEKP